MVNEENVIGHWQLLWKMLLRSYQSKLKRTKSVCQDKSVKFHSGPLLPLGVYSGLQFSSEMGRLWDKQIGNMIVIRLQRLCGKNRDGFPLGA